MDLINKNQKQFIVLICNVVIVVVVVVAATTTIINNLCIHQCNCSRFMENKYRSIAFIKPKKERKKKQKNKK